MVRVGVRKAALNEVSTGLLVVGLHAGEEPPASVRAAAEPALSGGDFSGKEGETAMLYADLAAPRLLLVGLGEHSSFTLDRLRRISAIAARRARSLGTQEAALVLREPGNAGLEASARAAAEGATLGLYRFTRYKTGRAESDRELDGFDLVLDDSTDTEPASRGAEVGVRVAAAAVLARDLANEPSNTATPEHLANQAREIADRYGMGVEVLDRAGIEDEGLAGLATVGRSAENGPRFIVLEHRKGGDDAPLVRVGKAVTFDSGGISLKPGAKMSEMKFDMSGGAAVLEAMNAIAALELPVRITAVVPATENMPSGGSVKPGDIVTAKNGTTIEVNNTDAEGRLILADALSYAVEQGVERIVNFATLTGAIIVALGHTYAGLFSNDDEWANRVLAAAQAAGEPAWRMPVSDDYKKRIESMIADFKNYGGRPDATAAALLLSKFAGDTPWVHLDIAGTAWYDDATPYAPKGASGAGVRTLIELACGDV